MERLQRNFASSEYVEYEELSTSSVITIEVKIPHYDLYCKIEYRCNRSPSETEEKDRLAEIARLEREAEFQEELKRSRHRMVAEMLGIPAEERDEWIERAIRRDDEAMEAYWAKSAKQFAT